MKGKEEEGEAKRGRGEKMRREKRGKTWVRRAGEARGDRGRVTKADPLSNLFLRSLHAVTRLALTFLSARAIGERCRRVGGLPDAPPPARPAITSPKRG